MYSLGVVAGEPIGVGRYLLGQLMVSSAQITAHYVNEFADLEVDRTITNRTLFSGGSGVLVEGKLSPGVALRAAFVSSAITVGAAVVIAADRPMTALFVSLALAVSWAYSIPPLRLLGTGWGELATTIVVTLLVPLIGVTITGASAPTALWWSIGILAPIHMAMMLVFELPDLESDRASGKMVLGARIGRRWTLRIVTMLLGLAIFLLFVRLMTIGSAGFLVYVGAVGTGAAVVIAARNERHFVSTSSSVALLGFTAVVLIFAN